MQPKELMELAAKAVGLNYCHATGFACRPNGEPPKPWNPWENSGDALDLAADLGMLVSPDPQSNVVARIHNPERIGVVLYVDENNNCVRSTTRRAIVNLAAKLACKMGHGEWRS